MLLRFFYIFGLLITKHHMWNDVEYLYKMWYNYVKLLGNKVGWKGILSQIRLMKKYK